MVSSNSNHIYGNYLLQILSQTFQSASILNASWFVRELSCYLLPCSSQPTIGLLPRRCPVGLYIYKLWHRLQN